MERYKPYFKESDIKISKNTQEVIGKHIKDKKYINKSNILKVSFEDMIILHNILNDKLKSCKDKEERIKIKKAIDEITDKRFNEDNNIEEKAKSLIINITKGSGLIDKRLSFSDYNILRQWSRTQPKVTGFIYRVIRVNIDEFYDKHLYNTHNKNGLSKDDPIFIKQFESWTKDRKRVYSYGHPKWGQEAILLITDSSKIKCVDISHFSIYPEEQEVRNLEDIYFKIKKLHFGSVGWELLLEEI